MAGRQAAAGHVVDDRLRYPGVGRVHADQGDPGPGELAELAAGQRQAHGQHPVGPVRRQQRLQVPVALGRAVRVAHDRVVALLLEHGQRAGHPDHGRRPGQVGDDERHGARRAADQGRRGVARPVAEPLDRVEHRTKRGLAYLVAPVEHARDRADSHTGVGGHVRDGDTAIASGGASRDR